MCVCVTSLSIWESSNCDVSFREHIPGTTGQIFTELIMRVVNDHQGGTVDEWLACWTQAQKGPGSNRSRDAVG